ncbi:hypothetical protein LTR08_008572 [Meristemomyces frigidus]|nr:hypothetical protein LTR08_008572 [Meristemomyces frigidus]
MKITALLPLALAGSVFASTPCSEKAPSAMAAIQKFCSQMNIMVPSNYAKTGQRGYTDATRVSITGNCKPAMWVPHNYCMSQFENMCSNGGKHGGSTHKYGKNGCQHWEIQYNTGGAL